MNLVQFFEKNWPVILTGIIVYILREYIRKILDWLGEALLWLLGILGIHVLLLRRFKKCLVETYRETLIGYRKYRIDLDRNFITLRLSEEESIPIKDRTRDTLKDKKGIDALKLLADPQNKHSVILGHPGSGKTTLLHHLLLRYALNKKDVTQIPIFVPLRELHGQEFLTYMKQYFKIHHFNRFSYITRKLKKGKCLVMFDGLDEVTDLEERHKIMEKINEFSKEFSNNRIIVTSRIEGYIPDVLQPSFHDREIMDLDAEQRKNFITGILEKEENPDRLIRQIESQPGLRRLAVRPLTLSLLTFVYQEPASGSLPENRIRVYEKCIDLMFEDRDRARQIYEYRNRYKSEIKTQILRKIAFQFMQEGKQSFHQKELKNKIKDAIEVLELPQVDCDVLIEELAQANGIFRHKTKDEYDFAHLTFQEYFAALEIQSLDQPERENLIQEKILLDNWREVFLFYVQLCELPGKLIEPVLQTDKIWFAGELAIHGSARLPESTRSKILKKLLSTYAKENIDSSDLNKLDIISDLSRDGFEVYTIENFYQVWQKSKRKQKENLILDELKDRFKIIAKENIDGKHPKMIYVPPGGFHYQEKEMILSGYWIGLYPVTNGDFKEFVEEIGLPKFNEKFRENWKHEKEVERVNHPVRWITWYEAAAYCNWLSQKQGFELAYDEQTKEFIRDRNGYRLPSEQEWEKAASWDDLKKKARIYPWGDKFEPTYCNNSVKIKSKDTSDVRRYENGRSFYGCYDMAGNVWEWTASWYDDEKTRRVVRGGSWDDVIESDFRCAYRSNNDPDYRYFNLGFRLASSAQF